MVQMHYGAFYHITMILFLLTIAGIGIYGMQRLNGDHQFMFECEYPHSAWLKFLLMFGLELLLLYVICIVHDYKQIIMLERGILFSLVVLLAPLFLGVIKTFLLQKKCSGIILNPLTTWGPPDEASRDERRRQNLRQMFIRRTRRECTHNCLSRSKFLEAEVSEELRLRELLLDSISFQYDDEKAESPSDSINTSIEITLGAPSAEKGMLATFELLDNDEK